MDIDSIGIKCDPVLTNTDVTTNWQNDYPIESGLNSTGLAWPCGYIAKYHFTDKFIEFYQDSTKPISEFSRDELTRDQEIIKRKNPDFPTELSGQLRL